MYSLIGIYIMTSMIVQCRKLKITELESVSKLLTGNVLALSTLETYCGAFPNSRKSQLMLATISLHRVT